MSEPLRPATPLDGAFLRWRNASLPRWRNVLGSDAEDFLGTLYLRTRRLAEQGYVHRSDRETFAWLERVAGFAMLEFRRELAQQLGYASVGLDGAESGEVVSAESAAAIDRDEAEALLARVELPVRWRVAIMGRLLGLDDATIAAQLGIQAGSVTDYVRRGVERAKERLAA